MAYQSTVDKVLEGQWSIREMTAIVNSLIDEVESHVIQNESLPHSLVQGLQETINNIEAEILQRRAALSLVKSQLDGCNAGLASPQREVAMNIPPAASAHADTDLQACMETEHVSNSPQDLDGQSANEGSQPALADKRGVLNSLQDSIEAVQSVIILHMTGAQPIQTGKTSSMVSFSILKEEMSILDSLSQHVLAASSPSNDQNAGLLEKRIMALPAQLSAVFNMEIQEAAQKGSEIDDKDMMQMVLENRKRTDVLRRLEMIADRAKEIMRLIQDDARRGQQPTCA